MEDFKEECFKAREGLKPYEKVIRDLMNHPNFQGPETYKGQFGEMKANVMLAFRHLEDLRMRLGKAIQAYDGGTSVYPR
jgi:hypothetical protein